MANRLLTRVGPLYASHRSALCDFLLSVRQNAPSAVYWDEDILLIHYNTSHRISIEEVYPIFAAEKVFLTKTVKFKVKDPSVFGLKHFGATRSNLANYTSNITEFLDAFKVPARTPTIDWKNLWIFVMEDLNAASRMRHAQWSDPSNTLFINNVQYRYSRHTLATLMNAVSIYEGLLSSSDFAIQNTVLQFICDMVAIDAIQITTAIDSNAVVKNFDEFSKSVQWQNVTEAVHCFVENCMGPSWVPLFHSFSPSDGVIKRINETTLSLAQVRIFLVRSIQMAISGLGHTNPLYDCNFLCVLCLQQFVCKAKSNPGDDSSANVHKDSNASARASNDSSASINANGASATNNTDSTLISENSADFVNRLSSIVLSGASSTVISTNSNAYVQNVMRAALAAQQQYEDNDNTNTSCRSINGTITVDASHSQTRKALADSAYDQQFDAMGKSTSERLRVRGCEDRSVDELNGGGGRGFNCGHQICEECWTRLMHDFQLTMRDTPCMCCSIFFCPLCDEPNVRDISYFITEHQNDKELLRKYLLLRMLNQTIEKWILPILRDAIDSKITVHNLLGYEDINFLAPGSSAATTLHSSDNTENSVPNSDIMMGPSNISSSNSSNVKDKIGQGATCVVRRAVITKGPYDAAIKIIDPSKLMGFSWTNFQQEIVLASVIRHPNIIRCYGAHVPLSRISSADPDDNLRERPFLALEYLPQSLRDIIHDRRRRIEVRTVYSYVSDLACGLSVLHNLGFAHRDLKPANAMIDPRFNRLKLIDFGESTFYVDRMKTVTGSPFYMAPEILGKPAHTTYGENVDVFSVGIVFAELLMRSLSSTCQNVETSSNGNKHETSITDLTDLNLFYECEGSAREAFFVSWSSHEEVRKEVDEDAISLIINCLHPIPEERCSLHHMRKVLQQLVERLDSSFSTPCKSPSSPSPSTPFISGISTASDSAPSSPFQSPVLPPHRKFVQTSEHLRNRQERLQQNEEQKSILENYAPFKDASINKFDDMHDFASAEQYVPFRPDSLDEIAFKGVPPHSGYEIANGTSLRDDAVNNGANNDASLFLAPPPKPPRPAFFMDSDEESTSEVDTSHKIHSFQDEDGSFSDAFEALSPVGGSNLSFGNITKKPLPVPPSRSPRPQPPVALRPQHPPVLSHSTSDTSHEIDDEQSYPDESYRDPNRSTTPSKSASDSTVLSPGSPRELSKESKKLSKSGDLSSRFKLASVYIKEKFSK